MDEINKQIDEAEEKIVKKSGSFVFGYLGS